MLTIELIFSIRREGDRWEGERDEKRREEGEVKSEIEKEMVRAIGQDQSTNEREEERIVSLL